MANVNATLTDSIVKKIMEGADPREAINMALDEKAGYHKEKRIRNGKAQTVNVKNTKRKVHHTLTADQKKAIKKAHSAAANKKRAKSLKKGNKMGLYKESVEIMSEEDAEGEAPAAEETPIVVQGVSCPACAAANLEVFDDPDSDKEGLILVCPDCGETFVLCAASEIEDENEDDDDDDKDNGEDQGDDADAGEEAPQDESKKMPACDGAECGGENCPEGGCEDCGDGEPEEASGLFFAAE